MALVFVFRSQLLFLPGPHPSHVGDKPRMRTETHENNLINTEIVFANWREAGLATMTDEIIIAARQNYQTESYVGLQNADRCQHVYIIGKTGMGKTTMVKNMVIQHILAGDGVAVIDPHGDFSSGLLDYIPPHRTDDLIYFNPADMEFPIGLNVLAKAHRDNHLVASGIKSACKSIWKEFWGPRMDYIFLNALLTLLECDNATLIDVLKLLNNDSYRESIVSRLRDPILRDFWHEDFGMMDRRQRREAIGPIENKIGQFVSSPLMRNIVGQVASKLDFQTIIDGQQERDSKIGQETRRKFIFIANLSKGQLGDDKSNLLGALLIAQFKLAAMQRATMPEEDRQNFFLFVDEFQNFCTDSFESILSESRKYKLSLTLSHQYIEQLPKEIRAAVFGNVGTLVSFCIGHTDAEAMEKEFGKEFITTAFTDLSRYDILIKPLTGGANVTPFRATTLPPIGRNYGRRENLIRCSREKYALKRHVVEDKMERRMRGRSWRRGLRF